MRRAIAAGGVLAVLFAFLATADATAPTGPVTIVTEISFAEFPFRGTFVVSQGATLLGCSSGTFVDIPHARGAIEKTFTCTGPGIGGFVFLFKPGVIPGPGDLNGHWQALAATGDFSGLRGNGDFSVLFTGPMSGVETLTGTIHFEG